MMMMMMTSKRYFPNNSTLFHLVLCSVFITNYGSILLDARIPFHKFVDFGVSVVYFKMLEIDNICGQFFSQYLLAFSLKH